MSMDLPTIVAEFVEGGPLAVLSLWFFSVANAARLLAYLPQLWSLFQNPTGARAVSCITWGVFFVSNLATALYGIVVLRDPWLGAVFGANASFCLAIVALTSAQRARGRPVASA